MTNLSLKLVYIEHYKAYRVYDKETLIIEESMHLRFDDKEPNNEKSQLVKNIVNIQIFDELEKIMSIEEDCGASSDQN